MIIKVLTLFPKIIESYINESIIKKAIDNKKIKIQVFDIRNYTNSKNHQVDDYQFGGGSGMVMMIEPIVNALNKIKNANSNVILTSPQGKLFNQNMAKKLAKEKELIFICGHYEGIDARIKNYIDDEISIGDYVLTGGELASLTIIDATIRMVSGIIKQESIENESYFGLLLDHDAYTKPVDFDGYKVPEVLLSGHHQNIDDFRLYSKIKNTYFKKPELLKMNNLNEKELEILKKIKEEENVK